ncbi:MAG: glycosyltransferase family 2 protein [Gammaproteobacteria bacterium]|nr:glycosyltransferase family 2 protein [Gammaproteobacteria bacterium]
MRDPAPVVSVIIPAWNAATFVRRAIDSALAQSWTAREVIVVNDGSSDATGDILASYGTRIRSITQPNGGLSNARNRGIREARGEFIALLDADDWWLPDKLARQIDLMQRHPDLGFCSTCARIVAPDGTETGQWGCPRLDGTLLRTLFLRHGSIPGSGSGVLVRRTLFDRVGLFDETLRSLEDIDMWMRLAAVAGYGCIDETLTVIVKQPGSMSRNLDVMRASAVQVMRKNRTLLPPDERGALWRAGYASVLADYAKWEYRSGRRMAAMGHLLAGLLCSPLRRGRMLSGLLVAMALGQPL